MASSSSTTHLNHLKLPTIHGGATAAPPPTPSCTQPNTNSESTADALSRLFNRLPPNLSLPNRRSSLSTTTASLPTISLSATTSDELLSSAAAKLGYFQFTDTLIPQELAKAAESDSLSLLELTEPQKESFLPKNWPLGYEPDAETPSFCLDTECTSTELNLSSLREFTRCLESVGLKTVEMLANGLRFQEPV